MVKDVAVEDQSGCVGGDGSGVGQGHVDVVVLGPNVDLGCGVGDAGHEQVELTIDRCRRIVQEWSSFGLDVDNVSLGILDCGKIGQRDRGQS